MKPDQYYLDIVRESVRTHIKAAADKWDKPGMRILDIAPNEHGGAKEFFKTSVETLDIHEGADYQFDLCDMEDTNQLNSEYRSLIESFDCIICTEVLEHTENPFWAADTLMELIKPGGEIYITTPFNLRIHNPLPDNWRFTEHGLRQLFFGEIVEIEQVDTPDRELMPVCYRTIVRPNNEPLF